MSGVKLILREAVHSLGEAGDLVRVKPGYARNYLLPQGKAILATESKVKEMEHHKRVVAEKVAREMKDLRVTKDRLEALHLEVTARAGEEGKLFGSVTAAQIGELLAEQGFEIDRRRIVLGEPIKEVGEHRVPLKLHREIVAQIKLIVSAEGAAAASPDEETGVEPSETDETDEEDARA
ncbi:MAG: 50S ribosomal protein L9 [Myxococcales bacterium]|nr:50S ribosomal protein L9 [Myxococcales bacterium]MDH5306999.1 50S ribosomal protein L9 [Myxococcales bacterium]MDH5567420.1 50S ribosomal protein L9 [Myxococcales bacterium]